MRSVFGYGLLGSMKNPGKKLISIQCKSGMTLPFKELNVFQGRLKNLPKVEYEKLRRAILEDGYSFAIHVWKDKKGKWQILDGHQRQYVIAKLISEEGYTCPPLPVVAVDAESYKQAKRKLISAASTYGQGDPTGLGEFLKDVSFTADELAGRMSIVGIDAVKFCEENFKDLRKSLESGDMGVLSNLAQQTVETSVASMEGPDVKMIQLFFTAKDYAEFLEKSGKLQEILKTKHLSGTTLECVREIYKTRLKNK